MALSPLLRLRRQPFATQRPGAGRTEQHQQLMIDRLGCERDCSGDIIIPDGLQFAELELEREPVTKNLLYRPEPLAALFVANSMELNGIFNNEDIVAWVISQWYLEHRTAGGEKVPVAEETLTDRHLRPRP